MTTMLTSAEKLPSREGRWTADDFDRACDEGVFGPEARLELIHGRIVDRMGQGPLHSILATLIAERLRVVLPPHLIVREEKPIRIAFDGEPVANIMVADRAILEAIPHYATHQFTPQDVRLVVEVAVTSAESDLEGKARLYAQAGISDYWVARRDTSQMIVHRHPTHEGYSQVVSLGVDDNISPLIAPGAMLSVRDLLGLPERGEGTS